MFKKLVNFVFLALFLGVLISCSIINRRDEFENNNAASDQKHKPSKKDSQGSIQEIDPIIEQVNEMTVDEKIGQMIIVGLDGYTIDDSTREMIEDYHVGGFILFSDNVKDSNQLLTLINSLKTTNSKNKIPLFISVDQEGGKVDRMPDEFKEFPSNRIIGQINSKEFSYKIGSIIAEEIKAFGFNMDFAPVLDINSNPKNPVIGDRAFGSEEEIVSDLGIETMKGIQSGGIISVVKHFPGHGDTSVDSHIGLPTVYKDLKQLKSFELIPFQEAIKNNADVVMIAHILLNKIDAQNPASLSKTIITDILRGELNFEGVVITDDMTMGAVTNNYEIDNGAVKAIKAGSDIALVCHGYENGRSVINGIKQAVEDGIIPKERIDESVYRILKLKQKYNLTDDTIESIDIEKINNKISSILDDYLKDD